ncbi:MAG: ribosome assembly cofactor RimP [Flavobacteriaceae bacterium]
MLQGRIEGILDKVLEDRKTLFLISCTVGADHSIKIVLDGDKGVNLQDCIDVSRAVESQLDRDELDFSLEVSSAGAAAPLIVPRQYKKNLGRKLSIKTPQQHFEGNLTAADSEMITLEWKSREPKPVGKGKVTVKNKKDIPIEEIEEAKVVLKF